MRKIKTIFDRNWTTNRKVNPTIAVDFNKKEFSDACVGKVILEFSLAGAIPRTLWVGVVHFEEAIATEKLDGMNVRVTVRSGTLVRLEKRRNPSKVQKQNGITEPWYVDAQASDAQDKWLFDAVRNTDFKEVKDGEWSAEALGKNIQGNPLLLDYNEIFIFSLPEWREKIILKDVPSNYEELKTYMENQKSLIGNNAPIEGIVWHHPNGDMVKIKRKDF